MPGLSMARSSLLTAAAAAAVAGIGVAIVVVPWVALPVSLAAGAVMLLAASRSRLPGLYLAILGSLLGGYLLFDRGFAYVGVGPVFVGETVMALGILMLALRPPRATPVPLGAAVMLGLLGLFMLWGLAATAPHLGSYGAVALRDAALWGYATFAVLTMTFLDRRQLLERAFTWFRAVIPVYLLWVILSEVLLPSLSGRLPLLGGGRVPLIELKPGDVAVHLAGIGAFMMLGLHRRADAEAGGWHRLWSEAVVWVLWSIDFALVAALNRGGGLAILVALTVVALATRAWPLAKPASAAIVLLLVVTVFNLRIGPAGNREVSLGQLKANFLSIVDDTDQGELAGSRRWRLAWWRRIVDYTVHGPYFWTGKGYGVNLADDDGFQVTDDHSLRSPHNVNFTVLARSGVPGLVLWLVLQLAFAGRLLVVGRRARRRGDWWLAAVCGWVLAYWAAMQCNAAFDVYLEGPQGGIWFWSVFGIGLAVATVPATPLAAAPLAAAPLQEASA